MLRLWEGVKAYLFLLLVLGIFFEVCAFGLCALHNSGRITLGSPRLCGRPMIAMLVTFPLEYVATITRVVSSLFK